MEQKKKEGKQHKKVSSGGQTPVLEKTAKKAWGVLGKVKGFTEWANDQHGKR